MPVFVLDMNIEHFGSRNDIRMKVVNILSHEEPGTGRDNLASRYTYYVETLSDGNRIYLRRPANLHNGFDFIVCVENVNFNPNGRRRNYPKHDDIINDLKSKFEENPYNYSILFYAIEHIYNCREFDINEINNDLFTTGYPVDLILKCLKWLFIEQDIRYWNYSGRDMLWNGIKDIGHI